MPAYLHQKMEYVSVYVVVEFVLIMQEPSVRLLPFFLSILLGHCFGMLIKKLSETHADNFTKEMMMRTQAEIIDMISHDLKGSCLCACTMIDCAQEEISDDRLMRAKAEMSHVHKSLQALSVKKDIIEETYVPVMEPFCLSTMIKEFATRFNATCNISGDNIVKGDSTHSFLYMIDACRVTFDNVVSTYVACSIEASSKFFNHRAEAKWLHNGHISFFNDIFLHT
jgi:hypothetical protein